MAYQGLAKGQDISTIGRVWPTWYTGKSLGTPLAPGSTNKVSTESSAISAESENGRLRTPEPEAEEEMVVRGWGGDDDGDGMGML